MPVVVAVHVWSPSSIPEAPKKERSSMRILQLSLLVGARRPAVVELPGCSDGETSSAPEATSPSRSSARVGPRDLTVTFEKAGAGVKTLRGTPATARRSTPAYRHGDKATRYRPADTIRPRSR
jgi:hypothetical protein